MVVLSRPSLIIAHKIELPGSQYVRLPVSGRPTSYGILLLKIDGWSAKNGAGPTLVLTHKDDLTSTFPLAPDESGRIEAFLDAGGRPIKAAYLSGLDGDAISVDRLKLRALSSLSFVWRAMRRQPATTLSALYWALVGKKVRSSNRLKRIVNAQRSTDERAWLDRRQLDWDTEVATIARNRHDRGLPRFTVIAHAVTGAGSAYASEATMPLPPFPNWELLLIGDAAAAAPSLRELGSGNGRPDRIVCVASLRRALQRASGDWVLLLRDGDRLAAGCLWRLADLALDDEDAVILYGDHTVVDATVGIRRPFLATVWNLPYFVATNYFGAVAVRRSCLTSTLLKDVFSAAGDTATSIDRLILALALKLGNHRIRRTPRILTHQCAIRAGERGRQDRRMARKKALAGLLPDSIGTIEPDARGYGRIRYAFPSQDPPLVSLIVPTRDRIDLLRPCIEGLAHRTDYPALEIIVADNNSTDSATLRYFDEITRDERIRVVHVPGPFNFSAINNMAVRAARGSLLGFINNDIEVLDPDWLKEMAAPALQPAIGAVGAKLLYPSGLVQHAGVIVGLNGLAGHAHRFFQPSQPGFMQRLQVAHYVSAVTAACLVVSRQKFEQVGGLDERRFPVALNDVDLCLKLREQGYQNLFTPFATLLHKESASRAIDTAKSRRAAYSRECMHFQERWPQYIADDPFYHPELTRSREDFTLNDSV